MILEKFLVDTDVIIDYLRGNSKALVYLDKIQAGSGCYISAMTIAELYSGVREGSEKILLDDFFKEFHVAVLDEEIGKKAGIFRRDYGKTHGSGLADCIIAATAECLDFTLVTLNRKHFPMLKKVVVPYQKVL